MSIEPKTAEQLNSSAGATTGSFRSDGPRAGCAADDPHAAVTAVGILLTRREADALARSLLDAPLLAAGLSYREITDLRARFRAHADGGR